MKGEDCTRVSVICDPNPDSLVCSSQNHSHVLRFKSFQIYVELIDCYKKFYLAVNSGGGTHNLDSLNSTNVPE